MNSSTPREPRKRGRPAGRNSTGPAGAIQSLSRGLNLLKALARSDDGAALTDLSQEVGLAPSTTHRLLISFQEHLFVRHDAELGRWFIDVGAFSVGNAFLHHRDFLVQSRPIMHALMEETGETVNLAVIEGAQAVFVSQVESREMMRMVVRMGSRAPLHASGVGKAFLAMMDEDSVANILHKNGLPKVTKNTLTSPEALRENLSVIRKQGYAIDDEEHAIGLRCVASTIHDESGVVVAAISLSGPKARIPDEKISQLGLFISQSAGEITNLVGGYRP